MATLAQNQNPYVGPRTFTAAEKAKFFGRRREARDLTALIISRRLVLFYAPSGAGKSSLLNTMIRPRLAGEGFEVLPTGRVSGYSGKHTAAANIYVYNLLLSLHQAEGVPPEMLNMTLSQFLDNLVQDEQGAYTYNPHYVYPPEMVFRPRVLIIDQFEELVTTNAALWEQRAGFFRQLAEALRRDEQLWVVLTLREDFVARFDRYLHLTPNRLRHRYHMERLTSEAAREAIAMPVAGSRPFEPAALTLLVDNLRRIRSAADDGTGQMAQFVEPVQLQAVCYQMWEKLQNHPGPAITVDDVQRFADVDTALTNFYEDTIAATVAATGISEIRLRSWFERELVTDAGTRNMVFRGEETTGDLPTTVADHVRRQFILGEVVRPGGIWYELVHDRFVQPILQANESWREQQSLLVQAAIAWNQAGRPPSRLFLGEQLQDSLQGVNRQALEPLVREFIRASARANEAQVQKEAARQRELQQAQQLARQQQEQAAAEARNSRRLRALLAGLSAMTVIILLLGLVSIRLWRAAATNAEVAATGEAVAVTAQSYAESQSTRAMQEAHGAATAEVMAQSQAAAAATAEVIAQSEAAAAATAEMQSQQAAARAATGEAVAISAQSFAEAQSTQISSLATSEANSISTVIAQNSSAAATATVLRATAYVLEERVLLAVPYLSQYDPSASSHDFDGGPTALTMVLNANPVRSRSLTTDFLYDTYFDGSYRARGLPFKSRDDITDLPELQTVARLEQDLDLKMENFSDQDPLSQLKNILRENRPVIVLVDHERLESVGSSYANRGNGLNYLVVVGFDFDHVYVHDPANPQTLRCYFRLTNQQFTSAWAAPGTINAVYRLVGLIPQNLSPLPRVTTPPADC